MSLSEKLKSRTPQRFPTSIDRWLENLDTSERTAAEHMLRDLTWSQREIRWAFREEGFHVSEATIGQWRRMNVVSS